MGSVSYMAKVYSGMWGEKMSARSLKQLLTEREG